MADPDLAGLNDTINLRGFIERVFHERDKVEREYRQRIDERFDTLEKALELQAREYARRLDILNHAHEQAKERNALFVSDDKYETRMLAEEKARSLALERIDEKFSEHIKRYEIRHEELRIALTATVKRSEWEDKLAVERAARDLALQRVDEKFADYVKRYEQRQREVDLLLQANKQALESAEREAEKQARLSRDAAEELARKNTRNIGIGGLILTGVIIAMNLIGAI